MTTRYRVEYALKIEWIKGLLAVPFVLCSQPTAAYDGSEDQRLVSMARTAHQRYAEIMRDVENLVSDHINHQNLANPRSKLKMLVPTISSFFTPLALEAAFIHQDAIRSISSRRFVPPSFNDIRLILNTAQIMPLMQPTGLDGKSNKLHLLTFDGDVTLYEDGGSLDASSPVIPRLLHFLASGVKIGIVTAAGYTDASKYYARLSGLLEAVRHSPTLTSEQKHGLIIMGGESNYLFVFDELDPHCLRYIRRREWILPVMQVWSEPAIQSLLTTAEAAFQTCVNTLSLPASILRKTRAVGIYPASPNRKLTREQLEETVLVVQQYLEMSPAVISAGIPFCAFNGGNDVFVDIGDKSLGVQGCQKWFGSNPRNSEKVMAAAVNGVNGVDGAGDVIDDGSVKAANTLHVGDQFLSGGGNDFKARQACTTAWIASPDETVALLDEMIMMSRAAAAAATATGGTVPPAA